MGEEVLLGLEGISKRFPGVVALSGVTFDVRRGEVHALVGENGAGKSTLLKIIFGALQPDSGQVTFDGGPLAVTEPADALRQGLALIPQEVEVFNPLSVAENLCVGREPRGPVAGSIDWRSAVSDAEGRLKRVGLQVSPRAEAGTLSVAQKQLLLIARALAFDARLVLMDEPTSSLTDREIEHLFSLIGDLKRAGVSIIYVSHKLPEVFRLADRITVLRDGHRIITAPIGDLTQDQVVNHMVGRVVSTEYPEKLPREASAPLLEVTGASRGRAFRDISLTVHEGEIVGLFGLVGSGRTEFAQAVFGYDALDAGQVRMNGRPLVVRSTQDAMAAGIGLVPEDRKANGIFGVLSVRENLSVCVLDRMARAGHVDARAENVLVERFVADLRVQTPSIRQTMQNLSGGNQQKVILARWLSADTKVLILDEPTRGIDVGSKAEIHLLVANLARQGMGIIYISSELPEVLGISDRIVVFHEGRIVGEFDGRTATEQAVMQAIVQG